MEAKLTPADRITNSILYGDPRGYGYSHPTGREKFEASKNIFPYEDDKEYQQKVDSERSPVEFTHNDF